LFFLKLEEKKMNEDVEAELIIKEDTFCVEKLRELKKLSRDEQIRFTEEKIAILLKIINESKKAGEEIWNLIKISKEELYLYYNDLSVRIILLRHPVVGKLYKARYAFFITFRLPQV
jgi:hypothetical protein